MFSLFQDISLVNERVIPLDEVQMISISYISYSVSLYETNASALILKEYFQRSHTEDHAQVRIERKSITIQQGSRRMASSKRGYVEIFLPKSFFGTLNVQTVSGKIESYSRIALDELNLSSTSGDIVLGDVMAGAAVLSTVSGSILAGTLRASSSLHTISGSIHIDCAAGQGEASTVSGAISIEYEKVLGDIKASSTSGRVYMCLPPDQTYMLYAKSIHGKMRIAFDTKYLLTKNDALIGVIGGMKGNQSKVELSSVSGRIDLVYR